jgi:anti-anti-sigma factor
MTSELFRLSQEESINIVELSLPQTLDSEEFDRLNEAFSRLFVDAAGKRWLLDLSRLSYMGSAALGLMVNVRQQVKSNGGRLVLCCLSPRLMRIFQTCCLERLFTIVKTRDEALRELMH